MRGCFLRLAWVLAAAMAVPGCASNPEQARLRAEQDAAVAFAVRGYPARQGEVAAPVRQRLVAGGMPIEFELLAPRSTAGKAPLVIYLPGLGESPQAGELWRTAWARAGYAVLSVQLLGDDATAWQSELARTGDFSTLGRQRFADAVMLERQQALATFLRVVVAQANEPLWKSIDLGRVALAGYDLGAYTAQVAVGEQLPAQAAVPLPVPVRAAIMLSPYALGEPAADRYAAMRPPLLSISSAADHDPLDVMPDLRLRRQPFDRMPGPDKYLLSLGGGGHALLAGNAITLKERATRGTGNAPREGRAGGGQRGRRGGGVGAEADVDMPQPRPRPATANLSLLSAAVQGVSTAFLDACLGDDPTARQWLARGASPWLAGHARLQGK